MNYNDAVSEEASIEGYNALSGGRHFNWQLYSPSKYDERYTLSYFKKDPNNIETIFMQPGIAKGSVIRYIGSSMIDFWGYCGWSRPIATGGSDESINEAFTGNVIAYQGSSRNNSITSLPAMQIYEYSEDDIDNYITEHREACGEGSFVLLKDGTWKQYHTYNELTPSNTEYARTSDGFLRLKRVSVEYGIGGKYYNYIINYQLYDFPPQKPEAALESYAASVYGIETYNKYKLNRSYMADDEFVDVIIGFKNTEGCKNIIVDQTDSDYPIPFNYKVDPNAGCFTAFMNKKYPSTFKLTYYNNNGKAESELITIDLTKEKFSKVDPKLWLSIVDNKLYYKIDSLKTKDLNKNYLIRNITKPMIQKTGTISTNEGCIDVTDIPTGVYTFTTAIDGKTFSAKWMK